MKPNKNKSYEMGEYTWHVCLTVTLHLLFSTENVTPKVTFQKLSGNFKENIYHNAGTARPYSYNGTAFMR